MSFSNVSGTQRQQQEEALKKVLALSLLGSTFLHGVALPFSLKFVKPAELAEDDIEVVMLDEPKVEEIQPEPAIEEKVSPPPETLKPEPPPEPTPPEEPPVAATPPPIPEEPPVATTPPPIPEEPSVATPPPIPEEPLKKISPPTPPEPSPPPKPNLNPPETPKSRIDEPQPPSPDPRKSEPVVSAVPPKGPRNLRDLTGNPNVSDSPETDNPLSPGSPSPGGGDPGGAGPGGAGPGSGSGLAPKPNPRRGGSSPRPKGPRPGTCISCDKPEYPIAAKQEGRQGRVEVIFDIDPNGKAFNIDILTSSKHDDFDQAAIKTVERWKFASSESGVQRKTAFITFRLND
ncbi:TonB family protein [Microcoleus sp.]|uniref:TonB family protein n=1 Tax=Microcoleus sp. TaxID=44472 RepID=UPI00403E5B8F